MQSEKWLNTLYEQNYKRLYRLASQLLYTGVGHTADVQDVLQEVFLLAKEKNICDHPSPVGWLLVTTRNICGNYIQACNRSAIKQSCYAQEKFEKNIHNTNLFTERYVDETKLSDMLISLEQSLTPEDWKFLRLYCLEERSVEEIARETGLTENAVRVKVFRIRMRVKKYYEEL